MIAEGSEVKALEDEFTREFAGEEAVAVGSGSQALFLALRSVGVGEGSRVVTPTYVCPGVLAVIKEIGATAILVDIEKDLLADEEAIRSAVDSGSDAVIFPYLFGINRDIGELADLSVPIIEDCAHFVPSRPEPLQGDLAVFSFHATKFIAGGEGGMVVDRRLDPSQRPSSFKQFGRSEYKRNLFPMSDLQAALVRSQFERLYQFLRRRQEIRKSYDDALDRFEGIHRPSDYAGQSLYFRYPILVDRPKYQFDEAASLFKEEGVTVRRPVDGLLHGFVDRFSDPDFPEAERAYRRVLSPPIYPGLTDEEVGYVADALREGLGGNRWT